ncbi:MAG: YceI family protein [Bifidobacteriaceae bacterium]|nr:YceI family protein [Bifidobacteriaceae bacterium]
MTQTATAPAISPEATTWADLTPGTWLIDPRNSAAHFEVKHALISKIRGLVPISGGIIEVGADLGSTTVNVAIDPSGVSTGLGDRDDLLRGPNFFDVVSYPVWSFESTEIARLDTDLVVEGNLTLHGQTRTAAFTVEFTGVDESQSGAPVAGFTAVAQIDRRDFGLTWTPQQVGNHIHTGNKVNLTIYLVASPVGSEWVGGGLVEVFEA